MKSIAKLNIDEYIKEFPKDIAEILEKIRVTIQKAAPQASEKISYGIPTFYMNENLVHFAGYKSHIGFYPGADAIVVFQKEIAKYKWAKGSIQFPLDKPIPYALITKITKFRVNQVAETINLKQHVGNESKKQK